MFRTRRMMISLFALVVVSSLGSAQIMGPKIPSMRGIWNPVVGAGAAYDVQANNQKINMEVAVVGKEKIGNADGYWLEIHTQAMGTDVTMKNLLAGGEVKRMIIQQGASDPMELSTDVISMMPKAAPSKGPVKDIRDTAKLIGKESVTVPAGTFACDHYQDTDGGKTIDVWVSPDASPYGMVKMTAPNASAVLTKIIQDYQSKITKTPKRMM